MDFELDQRFPAPAQEVLELYVDPDFWSTMDGTAETGPPEVLGVDRTAGTATVRLRWHLAVELPREASRFLDVDDVSWVESTRWDLPTRSAEVLFQPDQAAGLLRASASARLADTDRGSIRRVGGHLKVRIPLLGSKVERAISEGIEARLDAETAAVTDRLG